MVNPLFRTKTEAGPLVGPNKLLPAELPAARFATLWHPWDFIQADTPAPGDKPNWERITTYPLEPRPLFRRWRSTAHLIGVSFGGTTRYCLLDIDLYSQYHPQRHPEALRRLLSVLEDIGLVRPLFVRSSASGGLHIYFPLPSPVKTFHLAHLLRQTLEQAGLEIKAGQLEIFPNTKTWKPQGQGISLYNAHRLPLQQDSYLLDADLNPLGNSLEAFLAQWQLAANHQDQETLEQAIAAVRIQTKIIPLNQPRSRRAEDWYQDEKARIEQGWTGPSQTNDLLLAIGRFGRVFEGLAGQDLLDYMIQTATQLPGYRQHCRHRHEIKQRCQEWQPQIEAWYTPYRSHPVRQQPKGPNNEARSQQAQERIKAAVAALERQSQLPAGIRSRTEAIAAHGISRQTLYKYKHLWHPDHYQGCESQPKAPKPLQNKVIHTPSIRSLAPSQFKPALFGSLRQPVVVPNQDMQTTNKPQILPEVLPLPSPVLSQGSSLQTPDLGSVGLLECVGQVVALTPALRKALLNAEPQVVVNALQALQERQRLASLRNPAGFLLRAIQNRWEPNQKSIPAHPAGRVYTAADFGYRPILGLGDPLRELRRHQRLETLKWWIASGQRDRVVQALEEHPEWEISFAQIETQ